MGFIRLCKAGCLALAASPAAWADFNSIIWDNDLFTPKKTDAYYSNGIVYHHISDPVPEEQGRNWGYCPGLGWLARALDPVLVATDENTQYRHSWELGQIIETPMNTKKKPKRPKDQPFAGLLYAGCNYHLRTFEHAESLGLQLGVVGPWSGAEETQRAAHHLKGDKVSKGWGQQLRNEVVLNLRYDRQDVWYKTDSGPAGLIIHDNKDFALGPLLTSAAFGVNALYAGNIDAAFGLNPNYLGRYPILSREQPLGFYALAGLQVAGVARNLFLDGNTWRDGPSVDREPVVGSAQFLVGYGFSCLALQLGLNTSTRTFSTQALKWPHYGTLTVAWGCSK